MNRFDAGEVKVNNVAMRAFAGRILCSVRPVIFSCGLLCSSLLSGCGSSGPADEGTVPVAGTVKLGGQPLEGADVTFTSQDFMRTARTDKDGYYQMSGGAKPLKYTVTVSKFEGGPSVSMDPAMGMDAGQMEAMQMADSSGKSATSVAKQLIPAKYSDKSKSELTFTVPLTGTQEANFELTP